MTFLPDKPRLQEKPSRNEDEWFVKRDAELIKARRDKLDEERRKRERAQHLMKCPKCGQDLKEREMHGVKVDACPDCHGIWLDQGELELLSQHRESNVSRVISDLLRVRFR